MEKGLRKFDDFKKYKNLIEELMDDRMFNIKYSKINNKFFLREMCDQYFSLELDEEKCVQLSSMFSDLAKKINEYEDNPPEEHYEAIIQEKSEDERRRLQKEEEESSRYFERESNTQTKDILTVTGALVITLHEQKLILYSHLSSFSKCGVGYIEASFDYGDGGTHLNTENIYEDVVGETVAHDECGTPRKRIRVTFKELKLVGNKMLFKEKDMEIEEEDIDN